MEVEVAHLKAAPASSMDPAIGNNNDHEFLFGWQLQSWAGDLSIGISSSSPAKNILAAFGATPALGITSESRRTCGAELERRATHVLRVPPHSVSYAEECHLLRGRMLCAHAPQVHFGHLQHQP